uniref:Uncharacterized protein n=1 Tax=Physcomitrium patens TaxID=3218 RepID=A0A2K1ILR8_PHYPA|nr:hypothetical protein PHYPA_026536 [Physcomitrium patens]
MSQASSGRGGYVIKTEEYRRVHVLSPPQERACGVVESFQVLHEALLVTSCVHCEGESEIEE